MQHKYLSTVQKEERYDNQYFADVYFSYSRKIPMSPCLFIRILVLLERVTWMAKTRASAFVLNQHIQALSLASKLSTHVHSILRCSMANLNIIYFPHRSILIDLSMDCPSITPHVTPPSPEPTNPDDCATDGEIFGIVLGTYVIRTLGSDLHVQYWSYFSF